MPNETDREKNNAACSESERLEPEKRSRFPWRFLILTLAVMGAVLAVTLIIALFASQMVERTLDRATGGARQAAKQFLATLVDSAGKFQTGTITTTFTESLPEVRSTHGDVLEVTLMRALERFEKTDSRSVAGFYLGTTVTEIKVYAVFRYHIRLSGPWRLAVRDNVCLVLAPPVEASLPPAIETDTMEKKTENGWARTNKWELQEALEKEITPELAKRAGDAQHLASVREEARKSVADFVRHWLMKENQWRADRFSVIQVVFPDEGNFSTDQELENYRRE